MVHSGKESPYRQKEDWIRYELIGVKGKIFNKCAMRSRASERRTFRRDPLIQKRRFTVHSKFVERAGEASRVQKYA